MNDSSELNNNTEIKQLQDQMYEMNMKNEFKNKQEARNKKNGVWKSQKFKLSKTIDKILEGHQQEFSLQ